jgi:hypothetical protein
LSATGNPAKTSVSFSTNPVTATTSGATSKVTIRAQPKAPTGTYSVTVQGTNGPDTHTAQITLTIN